MSQSSSTDQNPLELASQLSKQYISSFISSQQPQSTQDTLQILHQLVYVIFGAILNEKPHISLGQTPNIIYDYINSFSFIEKNQENNNFEQQKQQHQQQKQQQSQQLQNHQYDNQQTQDFIEDFSDTNFIISTSESQSSEQPSQVIKFNQNQFKYFTRLIKVIQKAIILIKSDQFSTKREIYYEDVELSENQQNLDVIVQNLAFILRIPRKSLKIVSSSKGLVAGNIQFSEGNSYYDLLPNFDPISIGENSNFSNAMDTEYQNQLNTNNFKGKQLSEFIERMENLKTEAKFILIVEKETVFFKLLVENSQDLLQNCILITGKGYPDYATKAFIKHLWIQFPHIPAFFFGDYDPYGFQIFLNYSVGNRKSCFEQNNQPSIFWLGIHTQDIIQNDKQLLSLDNQDQLKIQEIMNNAPMNLNTDEVLEELQLQEDNSQFYKSQKQGQNSNISSYNDSNEINQFNLIRIGNWKVQLENMQELGKFEIEQMYLQLQQNQYSLSQFILGKINQGQFI